MCHKLDRVSDPVVASPTGSRSIGVSAESVVGVWIWRLFLIWTAVGAVVMVAGLNAANVGHWFSSPKVQPIAAPLLGYADLVWMTFATAVVYLRVTATEGLARARASAAVILIGSAAIEWCGERTGIPFGPYLYTDAFGPLILGVLPIAIPLAWTVTLLGSRILVLHFRPTISRWQLAFSVALIAVATDLNLEFIAWKVRGYWIWYPGDTNPPAWPPLQNFLSWFLLALVLHVLTPAPRPTPHPALKIPRAALVVPIMNALFLLVHASRFVRG